MTVCSSSKPGSAPLKTSQNPTTITENWRTNNREHLKTVELDKKFKGDIVKVLGNDSHAVKSAQANVAKRRNFDVLEKPEQERQKREAALRCVEQRIDEGRYVSCKYPEFTGFVPQAAFGFKGIDHAKAEFMSRQLAALRKESAGRQQYSDDEDDEEDVPRCKNEKSGIKHKLSDIPTYVKRNESMSSGQSRDRGDEEDGSRCGDTTTTQDRLAAFHSLKLKRADERDGEDGNKRKKITWRAVSRGQPLLASSPAPNLKQPGPARNPWLGRVVSRGQVATGGVKDED